MSKLAEMVATLVAHVVVILCLAVILAGLVNLVWNYFPLLVLGIAAPVGVCGAFEFISWAFDRVSDYWKVFE